jgi:hypothetical protein
LEGHVQGRPCEDRTMPLSRCKRKATPTRLRHQSQPPLVAAIKRAVAGSRQRSPRRAEGFSESRSRGRGNGLDHQEVVALLSENPRFRAAYHPLTWSGNRAPNPLGMRLFLIDMIVHQKPIRALGEWQRLVGVGLFSPELGPSCWARMLVLSVIESKQPGCGWCDRLSSDPLYAASTIEFC